MFRFSIAILCLIITWIGCHVITRHLLLIFVLTGCLASVYHRHDFGLVVNRHIFYVCLTRQSNLDTIQDKNQRFMALDCLHRVLRFYLSVHGDSQPPNRVWDYLDSVTAQLLTILRKGMLTQDVQHDKLVEFCVTIAEHNLDFAMNHTILELLKQDSPSEAKVIGLRSLLSIAMSPTSQHVGLEILHGNTYTSCKPSTYSCINLISFCDKYVPDVAVHNIGHYIPKVKAAIEAILRSCHRTYSQALLTSSRTTIGIRFPVLFITTIRSFCSQRIL